MRVAHLFVSVVFFSVLAFAPVCAPAASDDAAGEERRGLWFGRLYTSTYRASLCVNAGGELRGTVYLRRLAGTVDEYTLFGKMEDDRIIAVHHSGHKFKGRLFSSDSIRGELTLKSGRKLEVQVTRGQDVEIDEYCRLVKP